MVVLELRDAGNKEEGGMVLVQTWKEEVFRQQHIAALAKQGSWSWSKAATAFEELII